MKLKEFFTEFFTWWNGQTLGTRFHTWRHGTFVGTDEFGNRYYRQVTNHVIDPSIGNERRWVVYNGEADPSRVPPGWRGWLAFTAARAPTEEEFRPYPWQKPHKANLTGTPEAYRPRGSILSTGQRPAATGDYVPWTPED